jgi:L-rhamnose-H+ transport protein
VGVMFPIFISGGVVMTFFFAYEITKKKSWGTFKSPNFVKNLGLIAIMAVFHYAASALFAYAASKLGASGNTVGYAIFNTSCVATAIVSGLITKEWVQASSKARTFLYVGLTCMVTGIVIIAIGNGLV